MNIYQNALDIFKIEINIYERHSAFMFEQMRQLGKYVPNQAFISLFVELPGSGEYYVKQIHEYINRSPNRACSMGFSRMLKARLAVVGVAR